MESVQLKLKQASAVLGVTPKDLQNFVQLGVLKPRKRSDVFWFDTNLLLQAKIAFYVKASLRPSMDYLAELTNKISRVDLVTADWDELLLTSGPGRGLTPIEIKVPLRELKNEIEANLPLGKVYKDLPRGRKRRGWKDDFLSTLRDAAQDIGDLSERDILKGLRIHRNKRKGPPEIRIVTQARKSA